MMQCTIQNGDILWGYNGDIYPMSELMAVESEEKAVFQPRFSWEALRWGSWGGATTTSWEITGGPAKYHEIPLKIIQNLKQNR